MKTTKYMDEKILSTLTECPLFKGMKQAEIQRVMETVKYRIVRLDAGTLYAVGGDKCLYADIIISGKITTQMVAPSGKYLSVANLKEGNVVAPAFIFAKKNEYPVDAETATSVNILRIATADFRGLIDKNETIRWNYISLLSNINSFLSEKIRMLSLLTVREKIASMISEKAKREHSTTITLDMTRQEIADAFGIQKFSVIRQLNAFQNEGAISIAGKKITILNPKLLTYTYNNDMECQKNG